MSAGAGAVAAAGAAGWPVRVSISNQTVNATFSISSASAGIRVTRDGRFEVGENTNGTTPVFVDVGGGEWASRESPTVGDTFEVMLETTTGTLDSGAVNTWLVLSANREWVIYQFGVGAKSYTGTLKIRLASSGAVQDTAEIVLNIEVLPL